MQALLFYTDEIVKGKNIVDLVHYIPAEVADSEQPNALLVNDYKEPPMLPNKRVQLYVDTIEKSWSYDYLDLPLTTEKEVEELKRANDNLMSALSEITVYTANQDVEIEQLNKAISELSILITGGNA